MLSYIYIPWLSLSIFMPIFFGLMVLFADRYSQNFAKIISLLGSVCSFLITLIIYSLFELESIFFQFEEKYSWIKSFDVTYHLGIDGISLWFLILNSFMTIIVIVSSLDSKITKVSQYLAAFLILSGLINGVFSSLDGILFYVFFEATLIPMYLIIGIWGGPNRFYAAFKFFLYTLLGSLLMFVAFVYLSNISNSFEIIDWHYVKLSYIEQMIIFLSFLMAFAVKIPMWPFHTWLPDAHVEAPTAGSIILASIMLKLGAYGLIRFSLPIVPDASISLSGMMVTLSLIAIVYIGFVAIVQKDMKKLVAYSSIAHMGFVTLGIFIFNQAGVEGAIIQMISHGFVSAAMFFCIGVLYDRTHSRLISDYAGLVNRMPTFVTFFVFFSMANAGLPATSGFVGEFFVIMGSVQYKFIVAVLASLSLILSASYSLWLVKRISFGVIEKNSICSDLLDVNTKEFFILTTLALIVLFMGVYPKIFTDIIHLPIKTLLEHLSITKL
ncbi:NADH dehydrogenase I subunit M [Candidatus Kinetoplastibacterium desouzaii TCC079E]|uniref:NADH dehydrogenase I subunit M n=1 Tax=Candidatus Kinetoplastidibacterium desouzai TCC079E TaxID=1208919 RepID=M1M488_9PROT|nr:NADH dehydrogenase I subunit M [Candidatus Kinetoplastibacterium desouzaii TCC079E]